jgi:hypothetical protein
MRGAAGGGQPALKMAPPCSRLPPTSLHLPRQARNVLLKGDAKRDSGAVAKVADFGAC